MNNKKSGMFADSLTSSEVEFSYVCTQWLQGKEKWRNFLNSPNIKKALEKILPLREGVNLSNDELLSAKSALFEIRIAYLIEKSGLNTQYEFNSDTNNKKTIDFMVSGERLNNKTLLIELSGLRESQLQKDKTWITDNNWFGCMLDSDGSDEAREYIRAQSVLIEKALKFPDISIEKQFNIILLDMRSIILRMSNRFDYRHILHGGARLPSLCWRFMKDGKIVEGIFCRSHPEYRAFEHLRRTVHCFGFVNEQKYEQNELGQKIEWFNNPELDCNEMPNLKKIFGDDKIQ